MKKMLILPILFASMLAVAAAEKAATPPSSPPAPVLKDAAEIVCACNCRNCPPNATLSKNKGDVYRHRRCFLDANKDGVCDNSIKAGQKCGNDCVIATVEEMKKQGKKIQLVCANCPCAANCAACTGK